MITRPDSARTDRFQRCNLCQLLVPVSKGVASTQHGGHGTLCKSYLIVFCRPFSLLNGLTGWVKLLTQTSARREPNIMGEEFQIFDARETDPNE